MKSIRFNATIDQEQVIRLPQGIQLPPGQIEVTVRSCAETPDSSSDSLAETRAWLLALATEAERAAPRLPSDMAQHHDHYAHGKPKS